MKIILLVLCALVLAFAVFVFVLTQYLDVPPDDEDDWPD